MTEHAPAHYGAYIAGGATKWPYEQRLDLTTNDIHEFCPFLNLAFVYILCSTLAFSGNIMDYHGSVLFLLRVFPLVIKYSSYTKKVEKKKRIKIKIKIEHGHRSINAITLPDCSASHSALFLKSRLSLSFA